MTGNVDGADTCASPKATGTHPAGVAERSTVGGGLLIDERTNGAI